MKQIVCVTCLAMLTTLLISCSGGGGSSSETNTPVNQTQEARPGFKGYSGYIGYGSQSNPNYGMGVSFYTAVWKLTDTPLYGFQIGLPGTWIVPDNSDNISVPLCPSGTLARSWPERGPTWDSVFQTLEGGLGYWRGNKFRYGPPKFSMNATPQCYDYEIASPGWSFFYSDEALSENLLGIAQLSNRLLVPPDALTFEGEPNGEFMGYAYMALPLTDAYNNGIVDVGGQSWTSFINTSNFKGPIAFYLPETWSKLSETYPEIEGRGLDNRAGVINGGAMEINTVPNFEASSADGTRYVKVPKLKFPVNEEGRAALVKELRYYNADALYNDVLNWRKNNVLASGTFATIGTVIPNITYNTPSVRVYERRIPNLSSVFQSYADNNVFGITWGNSDFEAGSFPEYFRMDGNDMLPIQESEVPAETRLVEATFSTELNEGSYYSPASGVWVTPGAATTPISVTLNDGSTVIYAWYRFIDQPVFGQYNWSNAKKEALQSLIEKIHQEWGINQSYIPEPSSGNLVNIDINLLVVPPAGMEVGYVPIVIEQY